MLSNLGFDLGVYGKKWDSRITSRVRTHKTTSIDTILLLNLLDEMTRTFDAVIPVKGFSSEHEAQLRRSGSA